MLAHCGAAVFWRMRLRRPTEKSCLSSTLARTHTHTECFLCLPPRPTKLGGVARRQTRGPDKKRGRKRRRNSLRQRGTTTPPETIGRKEGRRKRTKSRPHHYRLCSRRKSCRALIPLSALHFYPPCKKALSLRSPFLGEPVVKADSRSADEEEGRPGDGRVDAAAVLLWHKHRGPLFWAPLGVPRCKTLPLFWARDVCDLLFYFWSS